MQVCGRYDVVVIGGGTAGVCAAIQAGRLGARTLLVEKAGILGGTVTSAAVAVPGLFHAWGKQVIAGIGWDLVAQCVREAGGTMPDFSQPGRHWQHSVSINPALYAALCDEAVLSAGVDVLLHSMVASVTTKVDGVEIALCAKTGLVGVQAAMLVDCTGDATVVEQAGLPVNRPVECQPATLMCTASGYDRKNLDIDAINRAFAEVVRAGLACYGDVGYRWDGPDVGRWLSAHGRNANHIPAGEARSSQGRTDVELAGRRSMLRLYRFLRGQQGLEGLRIDQMAAECGIRETAVIDGQATVTLEDYTGGRLWDDAICYSFYPIDLHTNSDSGLDLRPLAEGVVPTVPLGALIPRGSVRVLAAGRCISSDRLANSALRVQATCMAVGQAAGAAAALTAQAGGDLTALSLGQLRRTLAAHGAIVPGV